MRSSNSKKSASSGSETSKALKAPKPPKALETSKASKAPKIPETSKAPKNPETQKSPKSPKFKKLRALFRRLRDKYKKSREKRVILHKSFRRSYREDYVRHLEIPGLLHHTIDVLRLIFGNWKLFLPLIFFAVIFNALLVGLMPEDAYVEFQHVLDGTTVGNLSGANLGNFAKAGLLLVSTVTTGGLSGSLSEVQVVFAIIIFLLIWLITIYLLRFRLAKKSVKLRDAFYNALTPLISTFVVFSVAVVQAIPLFLVIISYSAAVQTDFLSTPFYALVYFVFACVMLILSGYFLSSTLIALVAVSAPGLYPLSALRTASDLMASRRIRFIIRLIYLIISLAVIWAVIMLPLIALDLWLKSWVDWLNGWPVVPVLLQIMTCFSFVYITAYLYLYYRRILDYEEK